MSDKIRIERSDPIGTSIKIQRMKVKLARENLLVVDEKPHIDWMGWFVFLAFVFGSAAIIKLAFYG